MRSFPFDEKTTADDVPYEDLDFSKNRFIVGESCDVGADGESRMIVYITTACRLARSVASSKCIGLCPDRCLVRPHESVGDYSITDHIYNLNKLLANSGPHDSFSACALPVSHFDQSDASG